MYAAAVLVCIGSQIKPLIKSMRFPTNFKSTNLLWTTNLSCGRERYSLAGVLRLLRGQVVKTETWLSNHELNTHRWSFGSDRFQPTGKPTKSQWPTSQLRFDQQQLWVRDWQSPNIANVEIKISNARWAPDWESLRFFLDKMLLLLVVQRCSTTTLLTKFNF